MGVSKGAIGKDYWTKVNTERKFDARYGCKVWIPERIGTVMRESSSRGTQEEHILHLFCKDNPEENHAEQIHKARRGRNMTPRNFLSGSLQIFNPSTRANWYVGLQPGERNSFPVSLSPSLSPSQG